MQRRPKTRKLFGLAGFLLSKTFLHEYTFVVIAKEFMAAKPNWSAKFLKHFGQACLSHPVVNPAKPIASVRLRFASSGANYCRVVV